ncbi:Serine/threonine-protein kinase SRK2E [Tetrabaena socialis]|uniref:non-specific serine/threonine protein kinase n=1 Tax=Tetrabaena socialis TaxID=47790 RepID=A0A2J8A5K4_9CHLO|nr:Serine/threonine-protein kinase SRK2E [Tetrabaena socialis]|eukprot:PNH07773.1 Serine/threonine-protein kinase SRK2E [Tetrabaena socialis]
MAAEPDPLRETGRYERVQGLGKGAFGFVQLGRNIQNGELAAIKFLKRAEVNKYVESEILNHSVLRHPHVIQFKEVFLTSEYICIAMEYATGGSLFSVKLVPTALSKRDPTARFGQLVLGPSCP